MNMKMKVTDYKRLLKKYPPPILEQTRYLADCLVLRLKDKLTIPEEVQVRTGLLALTVPQDTMDEITSLMRYDWNIFDGWHHRLTPRDNAPTSRASINAENLKKLIVALDALIAQRNPQKMKFLFEKKNIFARCGKKKVAVGERGTLREGLLKALTVPHIGIIKNVDVVLEVMGAYRPIRAFGTLAQKKRFLRGQLTELQSSLRTQKLGGIITLKWSDDGRNVSLQATS